MAWSEEVPQGGCVGNRRRHPGNLHRAADEVLNSMDQERELEPPLRVVQQMSLVDDNSADEREHAGCLEQHHIKGLGRRDDYARLVRSRQVVAFTVPGTDM